MIWGSHRFKMFSLKTIEMGVLFFKSVLRINVFETCFIKTHYKYAIVRNLWNPRVGYSKCLSHDLYQN